ncbi:YrdB family protein [Paenibacillus sp. 2TAB19]|uniref:YrdB family protein n=1 Tax=Paenibacillus sp. 2TAB19 TaxID=3233003 RepID=UPI003F9E2A8E
MFRVLNLSLRFLLEIVIMIALCYWGFHLEAPLWLKLIVGLGVPVSAAYVWGKIISPKATVKLPLYGVLAVETIIFGLAIAALFELGHGTFAIIFGIVAIINRTIILTRNMQP